jgi:DNA-binding NtrC family response regulator
MTADTNRILRFPTPRPTTAAYTGNEALLGPSSAIARVWSQIHRVAPHFRTATITGEPGSGAESAARALHALSPVAKLPFMVVEAANADQVFSASALHTVLEGLIFIPDVDKLTPAAQRGLVRKLRIRGRFPLRVVAAASTELRASVSAGRFSPELAEILGTVRIALPPLRERAEDLPLLATHLVQRLAERLRLNTPALAPSFHDALIAFAWPGNLEEIVQEHIRAVLIGCQGNKLRAAEILGISRSTLYRMLDGAVANRPFSMAG